MTYRIDGTVIKAVGKGSNLVHLVALARTRTLCGRWTTKMEAFPKITHLDEDPDTLSCQTCRRLALGGWYDYVMLTDELDIYSPHAAAVLAAHDLPQSATFTMLASADGAALLALLCNAAAKLDAALYVHKTPLLFHAITQAFRRDMAVWAKPHQFEQQGYAADTVIFIETSLGRMQWHVRKDDPLLAGIIVTSLPYREQGWNGTSMQPIARELAIGWLEKRGHAVT